eukprot:scaffold1471_cov73-Phaeocystis_antarctica.AAC.7
MRAVRTEGSGYSSPRGRAALYTHGPYTYHNTYHSLGRTVRTAYRGNPGTRASWSSIPATNLGSCRVCPRSRRVGIRCAHDAMTTTGRSRHRRASVDTPLLSAERRKSRDRRSEDR